MSVCIVIYICLSQPFHSHKFHVFMNMDDDDYDDDDIHYCDDVLKHFLYCLEILYSHILLSAFELHPSQRKISGETNAFAKNNNNNKKNKLPSTSAHCIDMRIKRKCIFYKRKMSDTRMNNK